jgi:hypothetical protein
MTHPYLEKRIEFRRTIEFTDMCITRKINHMLKSWPMCLDFVSQNRSTTFRFAISKFHFCFWIECRDSILRFDTRVLFRTFQTLG